MQSSPINSQQLKPATIKSPLTAVALRPGTSTSPRKDSAQLSSRSPNAHSALTGTLRMGSFYEIDSSFTRLREALKPDPKAARTSALPALLNELQGAIKVSTLEGEKAFTRRSYAACRLHLAAAKSNQVLMLGKIDSSAEADMSDDRRTAIRSACGEIGAALTRMLIQATTMENASAQEKLLKQKARDDDSDSDSDSDDGPPSSPPPAEPAERHRNSPARSTQKRAQSDADSPVLAQSPGKRQKIDTAPSRTTTANTTAAGTTATTTTTTATTTTDTTTAATNATATTTTSTVPPSPPTYRPAPQLQIEHVASGATPVDSPGKPDKPATASSTSHASPKKMRMLSPQTRPRPRSQLFVAPPDFPSQVRDELANLARAAAPLQAPPGATPTNAVESAQPGADSSGLRS